MAVPVGGALASRGLARGRVRIVADVGLVGRPLGDHGDDPVRLRGQVRDPLAVAVRLLVVGALPPGERVSVTREPVPVQVLADVVLERLVRGVAAGRPVAGESDGVPVADPVRVHGHVVGERRVEIVFVSAVRGGVPAVEPVAGNLARVAGRPTGFVGGGRVVGHGPACGCDGRVAAGGRVHVVGERGVDGPQRVYGLRPGGHDDLRPDVRVQRVPVHGVADGHVPVVGVRVRAPTVERAVGPADLAGIPAVGVGLRGRQCDPGAGRIVDLAAGHHVRARVDGLDGHAAVLMRGGALHEVGHLAVGLRFRGPSGVSGRVGRDGTGGIPSVLVVGETVGDGRIDRLEAGLAGLSRGDRPAGAEGRAGERGTDVMLHSMRVGIVLVLVRDAGPAVRAEPGEMRVGAHVRAVEAADEFDALVVSAGAAVNVGESGHTTQPLRRRTVVQQEIDGHIHVRAGRGMQVPLAIRCHELTCRWDINQRAEVLAVHGDPGVEPPLRAGGVAPLSHMVQDQVRAILVRLVHGGQNLAGVCLVLFRGIPVRFDGEAVHVSDLVRGKTINCGELEIAVLRGGDFTVLQIMHSQAGSGFVRHRPHRSGGLGIGGLDGVLLAVLTGGHAAGRIRRVLIVGQLVGAGEGHIIQKIALGGVEIVDGLETEPGGGLPVRDDVVALIGLPLVVMMPAVPVRDPRADGLGLLAYLVAGLAVRGHSGHLDGCAVDDDLHLVDVVLAQAGVLQPDLVQCAGDGGEVLVDGASGFGRDHFRVGVAVRAVLLEFDRFRAVLQSALVLAAFLVGPPCKFGLVETGPVRPGGEIGVGVFRVPHVLAVVRVDARVCVRHVAWRVNGLPSAVGQVFEITIDQMVRQACVRVRDVLHAARGTGFGGFDGGGVVRGLAGRLVGVLVVGQFVRFGEHDVVEQVAAGRVHAGYLPEREPGDGLACGDRVVADVVAEVVLAGLVAERVGRVRGDGGGLLADLVAVLVRAGAGHFDGLLVAGRAYHDLHLVKVDAVAARVVELDPVERAGRGGDVLVDRGAFLACAQFAHLGGFAGGLLEFDGVRALFGHGALCLGAGPAESGRVQSAGDVGPFGEVASLSVADPLAAVAVDAGEVVLQALHARVFEVAVDEVVRQFVRGRVRRGLHGTGAGRGRGFGAVGLRPGRDGTRSILSVLVVG